jgi:hypothetical protein
MFASVMGFRDYVRCVGSCEEKHVSMNFVHSLLLYMCGGGYGAQDWYNVTKLNV